MNLCTFSAVEFVLDRDLLTSSFTEHSLIELAVASGVSSSECAGDWAGWESWAWTRENYNIQHNCFDFLFSRSNSTLRTNGTVLVRQTNEITMKNKTISPQDESTLKSHNSFNKKIGICQWARLTAGLDFFSIVLFGEDLTFRFLGEDVSATVAEIPKYASLFRFCCSY